MIKGTDNIHMAIEKIAALGIGMRVKDIDKGGCPLDIRLGKPGDTEPIGIILL